MNAPNEGTAFISRRRRIERLQRHTVFLMEYGLALKKFCAGIRDVIFPAGTWWMRVHYGVACRAPP